LFNLQSKKVEYTDYHMPIPYKQFKNIIVEVFELSKKNGYI